MDDDDNDIDEYAEESQHDDAQAAAYEKKGTDDRALVDQQAKEYDEMKRRKREEITHLKQARLNAQSKLSKKERELAALEIQLRKSAYMNTRERVAEARIEVEQRGSATREDQAVIEVDEIKRENKDEIEDEKHRSLLAEVAALKNIDNEAARKISLLEHELLRS